MKGKSFKLIFGLLIIILICGSKYLTSEKYIPVPETISNDGIPGIPYEVKHTMDLYLKQSSTVFLDWAPNDKDIIVKSRQGNTSEIYLVSDSNDTMKQLTCSEEPVFSAVSCPDSNKHYLIYSEDINGNENYQFYKYNLDDGRSTLISDGINRHLRPMFNHKGDRIAYSSNARTGALEDIYVMDPENPEDCRIVFESLRPSYLYPYSWFYDDKRIIVLEVISINTCNTYIVDTETCEYSLVHSGIPDNCFYAMPFSSCKGNYLIGRTDCMGEFQQLAKKDLNTNVTTILAEEIPWDTESIAVPEDFSMVAFVANCGGVDNLYLIDTESWETLLIDNLPKGQISGIDFNKRGNKLAMTISNTDMQADVFVYDIDAKECERWTMTERTYPMEREICEPELVYFPTFDSLNGSKRLIPAYYYSPTIKDTHPTPVIVLIHGGPEAQFVPDYNAQINFWTQELGVAVLAPNIRGSSGYGKKYLLLDNGKKREDAVKDIGALFDWICSQPELDNDKIAVYGASYGGYMVLSSLFHYSEHICCGVDIVGISNFNTFLKNTSPYRVDFRREEYGDEREISDFLNKISPLTHADKISSPLLVIQGKNDARVPWTEAEQIVRTVRRNNVEVWYQLLENEGHVFLKKDNSDFVNYTTTEFFRQHLLR